MSAEFARGFEGMINEPTTIDELVKTREDLITELAGKMPMEHRRFLLSLKRGEPDWKLLGVPGAEALPPVRWRMQNLEKMDKAKRTALIARLEKVLQAEAKA